MAHCLQGELLQALRGLAGLLQHMQHRIEFRAAADVAVRLDLADQPGRVFVRNIAFRPRLIDQDVGDGLWEEFIPGVRIGQLGIVQPEQRGTFLQGDGHVAVDETPERDDIVRIHVPGGDLCGDKFIQIGLGHGFPLGDFDRDFGAKTLIFR